MGTAFGRLASADFDHIVGVTTALAFAGGQLAQAEEALNAKKKGAKALDALLQAYNLLGFAQAHLQSTSSPDKSSLQMFRELQDKASRLHTLLTLKMI